MESNELDPKMDTQCSLKTRVCLVGSSAQNEDLKSKLTELDYPFVTSETGAEYMMQDDLQYETVFVLQEFNGELYEKLKTNECRVISPYVINYVSASIDKKIPYFHRPLYSTCMVGLTVCFTHLTKKDMKQCVDNSHWMGAAIRKDITEKVDVLVTNSPHGVRFKRAVSYGIPVVREGWVHHCWKERHRETPFKATDDEFFIPFKFKPFDGCILSFFGFEEHEKEEMMKVAQTQGGEVLDDVDSTCTHLVVDPMTENVIPTGSNQMFTVRPEWFWESIQVEARSKESNFFLESKEQKIMTRSSSSLLGGSMHSSSSLLGTPRMRDSTGGTVRYSSGKNVRKRLREETRVRSQNDRDAPRDTLPSKRPSTDLSTCLSDAMLDVSNTSAAHFVQSPVNAAFSPFWELKKSTKPIRAPNDRSLWSNESKKILREKDLKRLRRKRKSSDCLNDSSGFLDRASRTSSAQLLKTRSKYKPTNSNGVTPELILKPRNLINDLLDSEQNREDEEDTNNSQQRSARSNKNMRHFHNIKAQWKDPKHIKIEESPELSDSFNSQKVQVTDDELVEAGIERSDKGQPKRASARYHVVAELLQTEKNYVEILHNIISIFQRPLEDPKQPGGAILALEDVKRIFNPLPEIESAHRALGKELEMLVSEWDEQKTCVGDVVLKYANDFERHYPPFVNFFEERVNIISTCEAKPRFHAFLKINQAKRECGRQTLAQLLINPVQRLPRIILLLQDIKKHTERENKSHPDIASIENAIKQFKEITTHINENKRKTEAQTNLFLIFHDIEDCPPTLISSQREYVARAEAVTGDDNLCKKGEHLTLFIFTDCVEITKTNKRGRHGSMKSPSVPRQSTATASQRPFKHVKLLSLSHINLAFISKPSSTSEKWRDRIALMCQTPGEPQALAYSIHISSCIENGSCKTTKEQKKSNQGGPTEESSAKKQVIDILSKHRAQYMCMAFDPNFISYIDDNDHELFADTSSNARVEKKSSKLSKLKHAFSFNKTPKRVVSRANNKLQESPLLDSTSSLSQSHNHTTLDRSSTISGMERITLSIDEDRDISLSSTCTNQTMGFSSSSTSGLTPSMSVTSLCPMGSNQRRGMMSSTTSLMQYEENEASTPTRFDSKRPGKKGGKLKPAYSTMSLARPRTIAEQNDFPAVPTPPRRRRLVASVANKVASSLRRSGSLRRRPAKLESMV